MKKCSRCEVEKPVTEFFTDRRAKDGMTHYCKTCKVLSNSKSSSLPEGPRAIASRLLAEGKQKCSRCQEIKLLDEFHPNISKKSGRAPQCRICIRLYFRERRAADVEGTTVQDNENRLARKAANPEAWAETLLSQKLSKHHITIEIYDAMLQDQAFLCAICLEPFPETRKMHIDHNHSCCLGGYSCGKCVRGILCHNCNYGLGNFRDNEKHLRRAISYLQDTIVN